MTLDELQQHTQARELALPSSARKLHQALRNLLRQASDRGALATSPGEIYRLVALLPEPPASVAENLRALKLQAGAYCIVGGDKNQDRNSELRHFKRDDGAWFDFSITVREESGRLTLLAYDFEIRLCPGMGAPFLRFDLNLPDHRNEHRELRAHLHPGCDDLLVPAPKMSPVEVLGLFIDGLRPTSDRPKPRAPSAFETGWHRATLGLD